MPLTFKRIFVAQKQVAVQKKSSPVCRLSSEIALCYVETSDPVSVFHTCVTVPRRPDRIFMS